MLSLIPCYLYVMIWHFLTCISNTLTFCMKVMTFAALLRLAKVSEFFRDFHVLEILNFSLT